MKQPKSVEGRTKYQRNREDIWMVQVRNLGANEYWSPTSSHWFHSRGETQDYIRNEIAKENFEVYEYRATRYSPVTPIPKKRD